jgi:hypothetical protein
MLRRSFAAAIAVVSLLVMLVGPVSAASPTPATCWGLFSNDGQTAASALSSIGSYGQPGLSAFNDGGVAAFVQYEQSGCGF